MGGCQSLRGDMDISPWKAALCKSCFHEFCSCLPLDQPVCALQPSHLLCINPCLCASLARGAVILKALALALIVASVSAMKGGLPLGMDRGCCV